MEETSPTSPNWDVIKTEYVCSTSVTLAQLAEKYGVTEPSILNRAHKGKWTTERREIMARARAEANSETVRNMAAQISQSAVLDISIANGLKRQIMRHIKLADDAIAKDEHAKPMEPNVIRQLSAAADHVQKIGKLAVGDATSITETNTAVQVETPDYEGLPTEEIEALLRAREIMDKLQGVPSE